jgi:3-oxoacyl-[acyl-carrier protein] reductase
MAYDIDLSGRVALITGASRGIGAATAELFAKAGATLVLTARDAGALEAQAADLRARHGVPVTAIALDIADPDAAKTLVGAAHKEHKGLHVLVNNAGQLADGLIGMFTLEQIQRAITVNQTAALMLMQYAARLMTRQKSGSIVNTSSIMATRGARGQMVYASTKAAMIGATRAAARELGPSNVRVNCIVPGYIDTDMIKVVDEATHAERVARIGLRRPGAASEVAGVTLFLASDLSSYVTGETIAVDGAFEL